MSLTDKQREQFAAFKRAFMSGETGNPRSDGRSWTKDDVLTAGAAIIRKQSEALRQERVAETLRTKPANFHIVTDDAELPAVVERIREECRSQMREWPDKWAKLGVRSLTANDFEGTGVDTYIDVSIGYSVWLPLLNEGYYLPYGHVDMRGADGFDFLDNTCAFKDGDAQLTRSKVLAAISPYLSQPAHGKSFHMGSARYDLHVAIKDGYEIHGCVWDSLDAMNLLNEHEESFGLKPLVAKYGRYFGIDGPVYTFEDMFGNRSPAPFSVELVGIYAIKDVLYGWKLTEWQFEQMAQASSGEYRGKLLDCYAQIDSKLPETDVFLSRSGFCVDLDGLAALEAEFVPLLEQAQADVFTAYDIDAEFVRKMDRTLNAKKIAEWITKQKARLARNVEAQEKQRAVITECEAAGKTALKKYTNAIDRLRELEAEAAELAPADEEHAPLFVEEFSITNGNHLAYLIYDHLGIRDRTGQFKRGKTRSTAADVLAAYYEEEEALKPLATVAAYEKLLNTYVTKIPHALEIDGRIHSEFKSGGTATGRYSSSGYGGRPIDILREFETEG
ncbi:DNA polymerase [Paenibacillus sediminis]|uniref:DNA-directed DNA polymerase n=1 Tax=Paenibacillus sediminis TaxID=664909 RepID=A0ABS4H6I0_9BACL|nr:DNA polymerase [Paenibacillus sediminis]MBP1938144.1 DNA polymerase-1 [Paenibacillus sediminis]